RLQRWRLEPKPHRRECTRPYLLDCRQDGPQPWSTFASELFPVWEMSEDCFVVRRDLAMEIHQAVAMDLAKSLELGTSVLSSQGEGGWKDAHERRPKEGCHQTDLPQDVAVEFIERFSRNPEFLV